MQHKIPKKIHQIWWSWRADGSLDDGNARVPRQGYRDTWLDANPDYEYQLWRRPESYAFVEEHFPALVPMFLAYPRHIQRCDLFRILLLSKLGGVYTDIDVYPHQTLEFILSSYPRYRALFAVESYETRAHAVAMGQHAIRQGAPEHPTRIANWWLAAVPGHPILANILREIVARSGLPVREDYDVIYTTGPDVVTTVVHRDLADHRDLLVLPQNEANSYFRHTAVGAWRLETLQPGQDRPHEVG